MRSAVDLAQPLSSEERFLGRDEVGWYKKYGVTFVDLQREDLELVRRWRNHPDIQRFMVFRDEITPEMQLRWYESLDPNRMVFSVVVWRGEKIGLTHLKDTDAETRSGEGGIAIWEPRHQNGMLSYRISIAGTDWNFLHRGMKQIRATVLASNWRARRFVRSLGFVFDDPSPNAAQEILTASLTPENYFRAVKPWRELIQQDMLAAGEPFPLGE